MSGPLAGIRVVEVASLGPGPFAAMALADLGAEVIRVERRDQIAGGVPTDPLLRGRAASIAIDLKDPRGGEVLLRLVDSADVLIEGFRPGVAERLGFGPEVCLSRNPRLVYGRITGWGQRGPLATEAGHDIDYLAITGALFAIGDADRPPPPPLNLVADFGGGAMLLLVGVLAALVERSSSGRGEVVDAAMVDGSSLLTSLFHGLIGAGLWTEDRGDNLLDGGAPFYRCYHTADREFIAVGAIEPQFYAALLAGLGMSDEGLPGQFDRRGWPELHDRFAAAFSARTRDEWVEIFRGSDACVSPVLSFGEAVVHPHAVDRDSFVEVAGVVQPAPAPRFARSAPGAPTAGRPSGADAGRILGDLGYDADAITSLLAGPVGFA